MLDDATWFRLSKSGVMCDGDGARVGGVALLSRSGAGWIPRSVSELNRELSDAYGMPVDVSAKENGLFATANALSRGEIALAQISLLYLHLPEPPLLAKGQTSSEDRTALALGLARSGMLKAVEFDPDKHPRWPKGAPQHQGGQFRPADGSSIVPAEQDDNARQTSEELAIEESDAEKHRVDALTSAYISCLPQAETYSRQSIENVIVNAWGG